MKEDREEETESKEVYKGGYIYTDTYSYICFYISSTDYYPIISSSSSSSNPISSTAILHLP
jgi:hypothetical protein